MSTTSSKKHQWKPGGYKPRPAQVRPQEGMLGIDLCRACRGLGEDEYGVPCIRCGGTGEIEQAGLVDAWDCIHGCNGDCIPGGRCGMSCHIEQERALAEGEWDYDAEETVAEWDYSLERLVPGDGS